VPREPWYVPDEAPAPLVAPQLRVAIVRRMGHVLMQLPPGRAMSLAGMQDSLSLPERHNRARGTDPAVLWLSPRAWVAITSTADDAIALAHRVAVALQPAGGHAVDLSHGHASVSIDGAAARALLAQGCTLDLDVERFTVDDATRTSFARLPAILHRVGDDRYLLHVDRSLVDHLWDWLQRGVREIAALAASGARIG
jgi:sarcosine oxidase subunit gamma